MAGVVIAIGSAVAGNAVAGFALGALSLATEGIVAQVAGVVIGSVIGSAATSLFIGKPDGPAQTGNSSLAQARANGQTINVAATDQPIPVLYGFNYAVSSIVPFKDVDPADDNWLYRIHVVSEGEIGGFDACYVDGTLSTDAKFSGLFDVEYHTGADAQAASAWLLAVFPTKFTSADRGGGVAYAVVKIKNDTTAYPSGEPVVTFDIRGKLVKDTRDSVTRFSPSPALCIRDFWTNTRYGRGVAESKIADAKISAEASYFEEREAVPATAITFTADAASDVLTFTSDIPYDNGDGMTVASSTTLPAGLAAATTYYCIRLTRRTCKVATSYANALARTAIDITGAGTGTHTATHVDQARYHCDGILDPTGDPYENLNKLKSACRSWFFVSGGQYHLVCDKPATPDPTFAFNEDNILGRMTIDCGGEDTQYNRVTAKFVDVCKDAKPNIAVSDNAAERTADGGKLMEGSLQLDFTTNFYRAQRIAQIERRKSRVGLVAVHAAMLPAFQAFVGDVYSHTHSTPAWTAKSFRLLRLDLNESDEYEVELREYSDAIYTLDTQDAMPLPKRTSLPAAGAAPAAPGSPSVVESGYSDTDGTGAATKATVTWSASSNLAVNDYQPEYKLSAATDWTVLPHTGNLLTREILDMAPGVYDFRVRGFNSLGVPSAYSGTTTREIYGPNARPAAPSSVTLQSAGGLAVLSWPQSTDVYVLRGGKVLARHCEATTGATWETAFSIGDPLGFTGDAVLAVVPLKAGTYLVKFVNRAGLESLSFASVVTKQATALTFTGLTTLQEDTTYIGTHSGTVAVDGILKLASAGLFDDIADFDSCASLDDCGGVGSAGVYTFAAGYDAGSVKRLRVTGQIEGVTVNVNDLFDSRSGNIDDWLDFDGTAGGGSTDAYFEVRETDDNPSGAPTWSAWKRMDAAEYNCRGLLPRLQMRSTDPAYNRHVSLLRVKIEPIT